MKISYKAVWSRIKASENAMEVTLVEKLGTRGSRLTKEGKALLEAFRQMKKKCIQSDDQVYKSIFS
jgi:molybdate transport system regulatory protein